MSAPIGVRPHREFTRTFNDGTGERAPPARKGRRPGYSVGKRVNGYMLAMSIPFNLITILGSTTERPLLEGANDLLWYLAE
jgi:hypothetical protein